MHKRLLAVLMMGPLAAVGCKGKDKKEGGTAGGSAAAGSAAAAGGGSAAAAPTPAGPANDLAMLAADSEVVLGASWQALQKSVIWTRFALPQITKEKEVLEVITAIKTRCGIDVQADPTKLLAGLKGINEELPDGAIIIHGLDKQKTMSCPSKFEAEAKKENVVIKVEGDIISANDTDGYGMALTFVGDRALFMIGHQMSAARVKKALSGDGSLASSKAFTDMHAKIDSKATVWGMVHGKVIAEEIEGTLPAKPSAVYGSVTMNDGISASVRGRFESPAVATEVMTKMKPQVDGAAQMVDKAVIGTDGSDVTLEAAAVGPKLEALLKELD